jgi:hypothetical protein
MPALTFISVLACSLVASASAKGTFLAVPYAPVSAPAAGQSCPPNNKSFTDPFACPPPVVDASWVTSATWALSMQYWRESSKDTPVNCQKGAYLQFRGSWVYGGFLLEDLVAQNTSDSFADLATMLAQSTDSARFDGTCVQTPGLSLGSATSLYNAMTSGAVAAAADFLACLESQIDPRTGGSLKAYAELGAAWRGPGLLADGTFAYDTHGWMHAFDFTAPDAPPTCAALGYRVRRLMPAASLPLSFFSVQMGGTRDCGGTWCANFTDYAGDVIVRRLREHRVNTSLHVQTEDDLPPTVATLTADEADDFYGNTTRTISFAVLVRQPHVLPPAAVFTLAGGSATLDGAACGDFMCDAVAFGPRPDISKNLSVPWLELACEVSCSYENRAEAPGATLLASLEITDPGGALLAGAPLLVTFDMPALPLSTTKTIALSGACGADDHCAASGSFGYDLALQDAYLTLDGTKPSCPPSGPAAQLGGAPLDGITLVAGSNVSNFGVVATTSPPPPGSWVCMVINVSLAAATADGDTFPTFSTQATSNYFSQNSDSALTPGGRWAPVNPIWLSGAPLTTECLANASCVSEYPYDLATPPPTTPLTTLFLFSEPASPPPPLPRSPPPPGTPGAPPPIPQPPQPPVPYVPPAPPGPVWSPPPAPADTYSAQLPPDQTTYGASTPGSPPPPGAASSGSSVAWVAAVIAGAATTALVSTWQGDKELQPIPSSVVNVAPSAPAALKLKL